MGTNGIPYHGPYVVLDHEELEWLKMRLAGDRRPTAVKIRDKVVEALNSDPKFRQPHE
jgi:hypothetical protein